MELIPLEKQTETLRFTCRAFSSACMLYMADGSGEGAAGHRALNWQDDVNTDDYGGLLTYPSVSYVTNDQVCDDLNVLDTSFDYANINSMKVHSNNNVAHFSTRESYEEPPQTCASIVLEIDEILGKDTPFEEGSPSLQLFEPGHCHKFPASGGVARNHEFELKKWNSDLLAGKNYLKVTETNGGTCRDQSVETSESSASQSERTCGSGSEKLIEKCQLPFESQWKNGVKLGRVGKITRQTRRYAKPRRSRYCHLCARHERSVKMVGCTNIKERICQKSVCVKCIELYQLDATVVDWKCPHCERNCPKRAKCVSYNRQTAERRERSQLAKCSAYK